MIEHSSEAILVQLKDYIKRWQALNDEYSRIPSWRTIKQLQNIKRRENLTRQFVNRMKRWGVIDE